LAQAGIDNETPTRKRAGKIIRIGAVESGDDESAPRGEPDISSPAAPRFPRQKAQILGRRAAQRRRHADASSRAELMDAKKILKRRLAADRRGRQGMCEIGCGEYRDRAKPRHQPAHASRRIDSFARQPQEGMG
jgi:hypothetical protein